MDAPAQSTRCGARALLGVFVAFCVGLGHMNSTWNLSVSDRNARSVEEMQRQKMSLVRVLQKNRLTTMIWPQR